MDVIKGSVEHVYLICQIVTAAKKKLNPFVQIFKNTQPKTKKLPFNHQNVIRLVNSCSTPGLNETANSGRRVESYYQITTLNIQTLFKNWCCHNDIDLQIIYFCKYCTFYDYTNDYIGNYHTKPIRNSSTISFCFFLDWLCNFELFPAIYLVFHPLCIGRNSLKKASRAIAVIILSTKIMHLMSFKPELLPIYRPELETKTYDQDSIRVDWNISDGAGKATSSLANSREGVDGTRPGKFASARAAADSGRPLHPQPLGVRDDAPRDRRRPEEARSNITLNLTGKARSDTHGRLSASGIRTSEASC